MKWIVCISAIEIINNLCSLNKYEYERVARRELGMDYNLLNVLVAVVEEENVSQAAERLNLSQPATSNALARLRTAMNDPVLIRSGNRMLPTPRAIQAALSASDLIKQIESVFDIPKPFDAATSGHRFKLALTDHGMQTVMPALLRKLADIAPSIELDIQTMGPTDNNQSIAQALETGELDFVISRAVITPQDFNSMVLFSDNFVTLMTSDHPRLKNRITKQQFLKEKHILVSFSGDRLGLIDAALNTENKQRVITHTVNNFLNAALMIEQTDLLCSVSQKVASSLVNRFNLTAIPCPVKVDDLVIALHWHRRNEQIPAQQWFVEVMKALKRDL